MWCVHNSVSQDTQEARWTRDAPLSERNRADAYAGMLDRSVYQLFVLPVEVAMEVCVQVVWSYVQAARLGRCSKCIRKECVSLEYVRFSFMAMDLGRGLGPGWW